MKNKLVFAGLLIGVLAIGIMVAGCASTGMGSSMGTSEPTKFEGTWVMEKEGTTHSYTFKNNTMQYKGGTRSRPGTFTYTDTEITFVPKEANTWTGWTQEYILEENVLTLVDDGKSDNHPNGVFSRQQ